MARVFHYVENYREAEAAGLSTLAGGSLDFTDHSVNHVVEDALVPMHRTISLRNHRTFQALDTRPDRCNGNVLISSEDLGPNGGQAPGLLASFASGLIQTAMAAEEPGPPPLAAVSDLTMKIFNRPRPGVLSGEAMLLDKREGSWNWQVHIREAGGRLVATILETWRTASSESVSERADRSVLSQAGEVKLRSILAAGSKVIAERGFNNATTKEIAAAAGISAPTMYQYIRSKDELLFLICEACFRELSAEIDEAVSLEATPAKRLEYAIKTLIKSSERYRAELRLIARETPSLPAHSRIKVHGLWHEFLGRFSKIVEEGCASGAFYPIEPDLAAHLIEAMCETWAIRRVALKRHGIEQVESEAVRLILQGILRERTP
jgi:TetR/AcrR family transcriptional regulator, cholesterol catabolism regulator